MPTTKQPMSTCSKHGKVGNPDCAECWKCLGDLAKSNNVHVIATEEDKRRMGL